MMMVSSSFGVPDECLVAIRLFETTTLMTRGKQSREEEEEEEARGGGKRRPRGDPHACVADDLRSKFVQLIDLFF